MVVAQEMQGGVNREVGKVVVTGFPLPHGLPPDCRKRDHDVAVMHGHPGGDRLARAAPSPEEREREHIGRTILAPVVAVERLDLSIGGKDGANFDRTRPERTESTGNRTPDDSGGARPSAADAAADRDLDRGPTECG